MCVRSERKKPERGASETGMLALGRRWAARPVMGRRAQSSAIKASPTVQRLIRAAGLDHYPIAPTGPKGLVTVEDVAAAQALKAAADQADRQPVTIELKPMTVHLMEETTLPTSATTNKAELIGYYEKMCVRGCVCVRPLLRSSASAPLPPQVYHAPHGDCGGCVVQEQVRRRLLPSL